MGGLAMWQKRVEEFVLDRAGSPPARVLEVGCGEGELAHALTRAGHSVTAIDPRAPEGPIFQRVGIEGFSDPGPFDHVVASLSLHHVEDLGGALDKIADVLRTGGSLVVVEFAWDRTDRRGHGRVGPGAPSGHPTVGEALLARALLPGTGVRRRGWGPRPRGSHGGTLRRVGRARVPRLRADARRTRKSLRRTPVRLGTVPLRGPR